MTCDDNGADATSRIAFDPALNALVENMNNTVTLYCPEEDGTTTYREGNQTLYITYDTVAPVLENTRPLINEATNVALLVGEDLSDYITCTDNLDADPAFVYLDSLDPASPERSLSEFPTSTPSTGVFIDIRCMDAAGNGPEGSFADPFPSYTVRVFAASTAQPVLAKGIIGGALQPDTDYRQSSDNAAVGLACTVPTDLSGTIMPDPTTYTNTAGEGTYPVDYVCTDDLGRTSNAVTITFVIDDTVPADPVGTAPIRVEVDDPAPEPGAGVTCPPDSGSGTAPIELQTEVRDSGDNVVTAVDTTAAATFTFLHKCVDEADNESAQVSQTVSVEEPAPPAPKPVLTLGATEVYLQPGKTHEPPLECTAGGSTINNLILSNDTSLSRIVKGVQNVTAPDVEGLYGVKYSCESGGQTADNMPELRVISDGTGPGLVVNASQPTTRTGLPLVPAGTPLTKIFACVDALDPETTMEIDGGTGLYFPGRIGAEDFETTLEGNYFGTIYCLDRLGNEAVHPAPSGIAFRVGVPPIPVLSLGESAPVHLMPGRWHVPVLTCADEGDLINEQITWTSDDLTVVRLADGRHNVTAPDREGEFEVTFSCESADGRAARIASDDTLQIVSDGTKPRITGVTSDPVPLALNAVYEEPEPVCTDTAPGEALPTAMITNTGDAVNTAVEAVYNEVYEGCVDRAGNEADPVARAVTVGSPTPTVPISLSGTAPNAHLSDPTEYTHEVTCDDNGVDATGRIAFNPPLNALVENMNNTVTLYCPEEDGTTTYREGNQTLYITYDTVAPVLENTRPLINEATNVALLVGEDLSDYITCTDNLDADPAFVYLDSLDPASPERSLSEFPTSTPSTGVFIDIRCMDAAGNGPEGSFADPFPSYTVRVFAASTAQPVLAKGIIGGALQPDTDYRQSSDNAAVGLACTVPTDLSGTIMPDPTTYTNTAGEGTYPVDYVCTDDLGRTSNAVTITFVIDDTVPADPVGTAPIRVEVDDPAPEPGAGVTCPPDSGSGTAPIELQTEVRDSGDNVVTAVDTTAAATFTFLHKCVDEADNESAQVSQTVSVEEPAPPAPKPVLTLGATEVYLQPGKTHEPPLECTAGGSTINNLILSNDTSLSRIVKGVQNVTAPDVEGLYGVKYSCESGGQTADNMPELRVISDGTGPGLVVNASQPTTRTGLPLVPAGTPLTKIFACVDALDPETTMEIDGGTGLYFPGRIGAEDFETTLEGNYFGTIYCLDRAGNEAVHPAPSGIAFRVGVPPIPVLSLGESAPVHLMPGRWHVPVLTCADEGDLINEQITWTSDDLTVVRLADGRHNVTAPDREGEFEVTFSCESADGRAARIASDDTLQIVSDGTKPRITGVTSDPVPLALNAVYEEPEPVCTDTAPGEALPTAMITNTGDAVNTAVEAVYNEVYEGCVDRAGNEADPVARAVTVGSPTPTVPISLSGTAPNAHLSDPTEYTHEVTCDDNGVDATGRIAFNPPLNALVENMNNTVTLYCPEEDGTTTYREGNQTLYITYDTVAPVLENTRPLINEATNVALLVGEDLSDYITCTDNLDADPAFVYLDSLDPASPERSLSEFPTSTPSTGVFIDIRCMDAAGNGPEGSFADPFPSYTVRVFAASTAQPVLAKGIIGGALQPDTDYRQSSDNAAVGLACTVPTDLSGTIMPDPTTYTNTAGEGTYPVDYVCTDDLGRTSNAVTITFVIDDTVPADPVGTAPIRVEVDDPAPEPGAGVTCPPDSGSGTAPIELQTEVRDSGDNVVTAVDTTQAATFTFLHKCVDEADNESAQVSQTVSVEAAPSGPAPSLSDDSDDTAYLRDATTYAHGITCTENGADITGRIAFDPALSTLTEEKAHEVTLYCPASSGVRSDYANKTVSITVDRTGPLADINGVSPAVNHPQGTAYTYRDIMCIQDSGSPVRELADVAYVDAQNRTLDGGVTSSTPAGDYRVIFRCIDAANNHGQQYGVRLFIYDDNPSFRPNDPASESVLNGTIPERISIKSPSDLEHDLECRPAGKDTAVVPGSLIFDPVIATIPLNTPTEVRALCLDSQARAGPHSSQSTTITIDTFLPGVYSVQGRASYLEQGPFGPVSSGVIHPRYINGADLEPLIDIQRRIQCTDSVDGSRANAVNVATEFEVSTKEFDYLPLGDKLTPQFIADQTDAEGGVKFEVVDVTCRDLANNTQSYSWILARDRPYHTLEGQRERIHPVIDIREMVAEVEAGPYYTPDGIITCTDYLPATFTPNTRGHGSHVPLTEFRPGINIIPHECVDAAGRNVTTATYAFAPQAGGPTLTITGAGSSVRAGEPMPVSATCTAADTTELDVVNFTTSRFSSRVVDDRFEQDPANSAVERHFHAIFHCTDDQGRTAWDSAAFTQLPSGPRIELENYEADSRRQTARSAIANFHIIGTGYVDPGARCIDTAAGTSTQITGTNLPGTGTASGAWTKVTYTCTVGGDTVTANRLVRTMASMEITFVPGSTAHVGGTPFIDDATCTDTRGNLIVDPPTVITGPDGVVDEIDGSVPGTYTIQYDCSDPRVLKGIGGLQHLKQFVLRPDEPFRKQVEVSPSPTRPLITIEGGTTLNVIPGEPYAEPGFACVDRPGREEITGTDVLRVNFTAGTVIPNEETVIAYTCVDPDGERADPVYRTLVPEPDLHVRINAVEYVKSSSITASRDWPTAEQLPTASCYRGTEKVGDDLALTIGDDGRSDPKHRKNQGDPVTISPRWNADRALTIESWNRTHEMTFTCQEGGETSESRSTKFHQVPSRALVEFPGREIDDQNAETRQSPARNLHIQGTEFMDGDVTCGYFDDDDGFVTVKLSDDPTIITKGDTPTSSSPVSTTSIRTNYLCTVPGGPSGACPSLHTWQGARCRSLPGLMAPGMTRTSTPPRLRTPSAALVSLRAS